MTAITEDHVEWAVVDRLRKMLAERPHPEYNITHTYALFLGVLLWTKNRIFTRERESNSIFDKAAIQLNRRLEKAKVEDWPWMLRTGNDASGHAGDHADFKDWDVSRFLKWLRDAIAHGDGRYVRPWTRGGVLLGFYISNTAKKDTERTVRLTEDDLQRIGVKLADVFCKAIRRGNHPDDSSFGRDAANSIVEKAA